MTSRVCCQVLSVGVLAGNIGAGGERVGNTRDARGIEPRPRRSCIAAAFRALTFALSCLFLANWGVSAEFILAGGAICAGYLERFGTIQAGVGNKLYIGATRCP